MPRRLQGDTALTVTFLACFAVICLLGIAYLGVFANVQCLAVQLRSEQAKLATATSQHAALMDQIGRMSSPDLIAAKAPEMNMELPTAHAYVDVPVTGPAGPIHSTVMAAAN